MSGTLAALGGGLAAAAAFDAFSNLFSYGYNLYTNERDFNYQRELQERIFEREDTAVQRRMADLEAAGLNPNLAAGSAAGAGAVVGRSNTNDLNPGSILDTISAANQIALQKQELQNKKMEGNILASEEAVKSRNNLFDEMSKFYQLGFNVEPYTDNDGYLRFNFTGKPEFSSDGTNLKPSGESIFFNNLDYQYQYLKNSSAMLQKNMDWYDFQQIMGAIGNVGSLVIPKVNFSGKLK